MIIQSKFKEENYCEQNHETLFAYIYSIYKFMIISEREKIKIKANLKMLSSF